MMTFWLVPGITTPMALTPVKCISSKAKHPAGNEMFRYQQFPIISRANMLGIMRAIPWLLPAMSTTTACRIL